MAQQQAQLAQGQLGLGQAGQAFLGQDVGALSTFGAQNQALTQAQLSANQQLAQQQMNQPLAATQTTGFRDHWISCRLSWWNSNTNSTISFSSSTSLRYRVLHWLGIYGAFRGRNS